MTAAERETSAETMFPLLADIKPSTRIKARLIMVPFEERVEILKTQAREVRFHIIDMIYDVQSGHPGGSLSATDIVTALYFDILSIDPNNPADPDRDRFVLSKGHACPVWYTCLALRGFFPVEELKSLRRIGSRLQGHPLANKCPGIDATTGSLGIGFGQAAGMALEAKMLKKPYKVYVLLGDGELQEGIVWEVSNIVRKYNLNNLVMIVDGNGLQNDGFVKDIIPMEPVAPKLEVLGWKVLNINGNDMAEVLAALDDAKNNEAGPCAIYAKTVKGKGVSFMENIRDWHGKAPNKEEYEKASAEIRGCV
jgi:transketolase